MAEPVLYAYMRKGVSVPFRGSCSEMQNLRLASRLLPPSFPSPFGVRVLKFAPEGRRAYGAGRVSVPFRGSCSEIQVTWIPCKDREKVSVPFRGSCSEIRRERRRMPRPLGAFPSPFGVRVLKFCVKMNEEFKANVSVPFRGSCSEIVLYRRTSPLG